MPSLHLCAVIDPYVVVRLHAVSDDESKSSSVVKRSESGWLNTTERKTSSVRDNGFSPQWNDSEVFEFRVNSEDVAMLELVVVDSDQGFIGESFDGLLLYLLANTPPSHSTTLLLHETDDKMCKAAVPVSCLRRGYRTVQFYDHSSQHGAYGMARVLLHVDVKYIV